MSNINCRICNGALSVVVDCGDQPIASRFVKSVSEQEDRFSLKLAQCATCGLTQLVSPPPPSSLIPRHDWIAYIEPEKHLDSVTDILLTLSGISGQSRVVGVSYKEDSTLERLKKRGLNNLYRLDLQRDLAISEPNAGIESIEQAITKGNAKLPQNFLKPDILIVRHMLEHAHDTLKFLDGIRALCSEKTYVVFEIPDCSKVFANSEYPFIWEEHVLYLVEESLRQSLALAGYDVVSIFRYEFRIEDSLVAVCRPKSSDDAPRIECVKAGFKKSLKAIQSEYRDHLSGFKGRAVLFGAGHLAVKFLNILGLSDLFDAVIDDSPQKKGLYMPGSKLPIIDSSILTEGRYDLCVLTVSPESEEKILAKYGSLRSDLKFVSAFHSSSRSVTSL